MRPVAEKFGRKYPFVKLSYWRADSRTSPQSCPPEVRANNVVADVFEGTGVGEQVVEAKLAQPFSTPALEAYPAEYHDPAGLWVPTRLSYYSIAYNTRLVPADKVPKSYGDLLDPQWKSKMASASAVPPARRRFSPICGWPGARTARAAISRSSRSSASSISAPVRAHPGRSRDRRRICDRAEHFCAPSADQQSQGCAGEFAPVRPDASTAATMGVPKGARHPHAAMLLIDYILSREGQEILLNAEYFPADPHGAAVPMLAPVVPKLAGAAGKFVGPDKLMKYTDASRRFSVSCFADRRPHELALVEAPPSRTTPSATNAA
jgi:iron(III) transport system substrate-binding protein